MFIAEDKEEMFFLQLLREGDGGRSVHYLQVALEKQGFISDTDDQQWWMFGSSTYNCVLMAQVSPLSPPPPPYALQCQ